MWIVIFTLFYRLLDLRSSECDVVSLYVMCCSAGVDFPIRRFYTSEASIAMSSSQITWQPSRCDLFIFDSRLLWQTVWNAADKSTATQIVRSGGYLWLNPIAIYVVICSRAEVVEWSGLKPCWSGAGWRYLLIVGRIRDSSTFAAGQRSGIGRYEVPREVSLPGFDIGMINENFHIARIWHVVTEMLQVEDDEFVRAKGLTIPTSLDCSPH